MTSDDPKGLDLRYQWPLKVKIWNQWKWVMGGIKSQVFGVLNLFWDPFLTSDDPGCRGPSEIKDLWRSKYEINEKRHERYQITGIGWGVPIPFWDTFLTSDHRDLHSSHTTDLGRAKYEIKLHPYARQCNSPKPYCSPSSIIQWNFHLSKHSREIFYLFHKIPRINTITLYTSVHC